MNISNIFKSLSIKGVLLGFLAMCIVMFILLFIYISSIAYLEFGSNFISAYKENNEEFLRILKNYKYTVFILPIITPLPIILGGYISSRIAKKGIYINSGLVGLLHILFITGYSMEVIEWKHIFNWVVAIPAALLGGHLAKGKVQTLVTETIDNDESNGTSN